MLSMCGPKYAGVNDQCKYNPQTERVESVALMNGPVFKGVESSNKYGIMPPKVEGEAPMTGPIYPGVVSASQYNPVGDKQVGMIARWFWPDFNIVCIWPFRLEGLWLRYTTLQNLTPFFPWIAPPSPPPWRNPRKKEGITFCHLATLVHTIASNFSLSHP